MAFKGKRVNVIVSDEAKEALLRYQKEKKIKTLDEALDGYILDAEKQRAQKRRVP